MAETKADSGANTSVVAIPNRDKIAMVVIVLSLIILAVVCIIAVVMSNDTATAAKDVLTMVLPVLATWIGTVIAFYFGRENFEAANDQVSKLVSQIPGAEKVTETISSVMRALARTVHIKNSKAGQLTVDEIEKKLDANKVPRLLIVNDDNHPMYVIHKSRIDGFKSGGGSSAATLDEFLADRKASLGIEFGEGTGFVTVAKDVAIDKAKRIMEAAAGCQDIIVTEKGGANEPVLGWVSNTRLSRVS
jgi:CBS domain-containing protein